MQKQNVRTVSLIVSTFTYLFVGAAIFDALEADNERESRRFLKEAIELFKLKHNVTDDQFEEISEVIKQFEPHKAGHQWKFSGAFYFCMTVITTIGYGHSTPKTNGGKIFCMAYALTGIPLNLVMFQSIGERLNAFISFLLRNLKRCLKCKNTTVSQTDLMMVTLNCSGLVLIGGAVVFAQHERWTYLDAVYYCFITLTTVGFGDYVALQKDERLNGEPEYVLFSVAFILFGLTVLSGALNLLVMGVLTANSDTNARSNAPTDLTSTAPLDQISCKLPSEIPVYHPQIDAICHAVLLEQLDSTTNDSSLNCPPTSNQNAKLKLDQKKHIKLEQFIEELDSTRLNMCREQQLLPAADEQVTHCNPHSGGGIPNDDGWVGELARQASAGTAGSALSTAEAVNSSEDQPSTTTISGISGNATKTIPLSITAGLSAINVDEGRGNSGNSQSDRSSVVSTGTCAAKCCRWSLVSSFKQYCCCAIPSSTSISYASGDPLYAQDVFDIENYVKTKANQRHQQSCLQKHCLSTDMSTKPDVIVPVHSEPSCQRQPTLSSRDSSEKCFQRRRLATTKKKKTRYTARRRPTCVHRLT